MTKPLALCTDILGRLLGMEVGRTASWPEQPSDCPVLTPLAPLLPRTHCFCFSKIIPVLVPQEHSFLLTPSLKATMIGGSRSEVCRSPAPLRLPLSEPVSGKMHAVHPFSKDFCNFLVQALSSFWDAAMHLYSRLSAQWMHKHIHIPSALQPLLQPYWLLS